MMLFPSKGSQIGKMLWQTSTHDASNHHKTTMLEKMAPNQHRDLEETFYEVDAESKFQNRQVFLQLLRNISFFACQGIPLRGHKEKMATFTSY